MQEKNNLDIIEEINENGKNEEQEQEFKKYLNNIKSDIQSYFDEENDNISPELHEAYKNLFNTLNELDDYTDEFYIKDENNNYKEFTLDDKYKILEIYEKVAKDIEEVNRKIPENKNDDEKIIASNIEKLSDYCGKDIRAILKVNQTSNLPKIIQDGRTRTIDVSKQKIEIVGKGQSTRQIIVDNGVKKIFTPTSHYNEDELFKNHIDKYVSEFPEYKDIFNCFTEIDDFNNIPINEVGIDNNGEPFKQKNIMTGEKGLDYFVLQKVNYLFNIDKQKFIKEHFEKDVNFRRAMYGFLKDGDKLANTKYFAKEMEFQNDESIDQRNSAMSVVAELLGMNDLLCHSESVKLEKDGKIIEGTMMNFAEGVDIENMDPNSEISKYEAKDIEFTAKAKKQISDLQILDFICGNIDRHASNVFYQYDLSDPNHPKLTGIQGIDNDCSFGHSYIANGFEKMVGTKNLGIIDKGTKYRINNLSPNLLKLALRGFNINQKAIGRVVERLLHLSYILKNNAKIVENPENYKLPDVPDETAFHEIDVIENEEDWEKLNISDMEKQYNEKKPRKTLYGILTQTVGGEYALHNKNKAPKIEQYKINMKLSKELSTSKRNAIDQVKKVSSGTKLFRGSSSQYNKIKKELKSLNKLQGKLDFASPSKVYYEYARKLFDIKSQVDAYLERKDNEEKIPDKKGKVKKHDEYTKKRISIMKELKNVLGERAITFLNILNKREDNAKLIQEKEEWLSKSNQKDLQQMMKQVNQNKIMNDINQEIDIDKSKKVEIEVDKSVDKSKDKSKDINKQK